MLIFSALLTGCASGKAVARREVDKDFIPTRSEHGRIAMKIDIKNDREFLLWFTKAELYMKVSLSNKNYYYLFPLNVKHAASGCKNIYIVTPLNWGDYKNDHITVELLDDDSLTKEEAKKLEEIIENGGSLLCYGANLYTEQKHNKLYISPEAEEKIVKILKTSAEMVIENFGQRKFDSFGARTVPVRGLNGTLHIAIPVTIIQEGPINDTARCDVYFYVVPEDELEQER